MKKKIQDNRGDRMSKYVKYIIFICFIIVCLSCFFYFYSKPLTESNIYTSEMLIYKGGTEYEIKVNKETKYTYFRENENEEIIFKYPREAKVRLSLPDLNKIDGENMLSIENNIMDFTYDIPFLEGCKYLKYLMNKGYEMEMYVCSSQYFEAFLKNEEHYRRVVLFNDSMMMCDMSLNAELPKISEYLKNYNFNNFIDKKFSFEINQVNKEEQ